MAARTSTGIGVGITVTILGVLTLALFVTTVVFMSQKQAAQKKLLDLQEGVKDYVRENEQQRDDVQQLKSLASKDRPPASVVGYLINQRQEAMRLATGSKATTPEELTKTLASFPGGENSNLVAMLRDREMQLATEKKARQDADAARTQALQDRQNEVTRVKSIEDNHKATIAALNVQLDNYSNRLDKGSADIALEGRFMGSGELSASGSFRPHQSGPDFDLKVKIIRTKLSSIHDLLRAYGGVDATAGQFAFFSEVTVQNGEMKGYIKPLFKDVKIYASGTRFRQRFLSAGL